MFYNNLPSLDLHGENRQTARILLNEFINDNYKLHNLKISIIHGIGTGILRKEVHNELKKNKFVREYRLDPFNPGTTIVEILINIDKNIKKCYNTQQTRGGI